MPDHLGHIFHDPNSPARKQLNRALAFSVGSLLGDVFLHLLPESYASFTDHANVGLYILGGIFFCLCLEKLLSTTEEDRRRVAAILNLLANVVDNASHGLAIGGSFLVSFKFGVLTTFAILLHEIPHEVSDFAILLRGDFTRWSAVKAQLMTSAGALLGAGLAVGCGVSESGSGAAWILPFTAGGFLNIALVQLLPDLLVEENRREAAIHMFLILVGIAVMQFMNSFMIL
jgi:zinc transporter 13